MITEDYVSFETAKLLKEKGFDEATFHDYDEKGRQWFEEVLVNHNSQGGVACPTLQMAIKWLREIHSFFIGVNAVIGSDKIWGYEVFIQKQEVPIPSKIQWDWFPTYEEACEAAIKHCLENLI